MDLLNSCLKTHEGLASQFVGEQARDLETCMVSMKYVYSIRVSEDFKDLVTVLMRDGASFEDAVRGILHGEYGTPSFICRRMPSIERIAGLYSKTCGLTRSNRTMKPMLTADPIKGMYTRYSAV
jgi:hypothetical protein